MEKPYSISAALGGAAEHLDKQIEKRRKAILGRLIVKPEGVLIEITTAAGFGADKLVPWGGINAALEPSLYLRLSIDTTIEEAVNPKPI